MWVHWAAYLGGLSWGCLDGSQILGHMLVTNLWANILYVSILWVPVTLLVNLTCLPLVKLSDGICSIAAYRWVRVITVRHMIDLGMGKSTTRQHIDLPLLSLTIVHVSVDLILSSLCAMPLYQPLKLSGLLIWEWPHIDASSLYACCTAVSHCCWYSFLL